MWARFVGASGAILANDGGIRAVTRNGVGDYTVQLTRAMAADELIVSVTPIDATPRVWSWELLTPTTIRIRIATT